MKNVAIALLCGVAALGACDSSPSPGSGGEAADAAKAGGDTSARVTRIVAAQLGVEPGRVTPEARFLDDLGADSLDIVELIMAFEQEFGRAIPDEAAEKMVTVGDAVAYLDANKP
jgi:acyl carrier protein